jgi:AraC family transcriptional regulator, transcriptional activator of pobA
LIRRGGVLARLDGCEAELEASSLILVPPAVVHSFEFERGTVGFVISFATGLAKELAVANGDMLGVFMQSTAVVLERNVTAATDLWRLATMLSREFSHSAVGRLTALRGLLGALLANIMRLTRAYTDQADSSTAPERGLVAEFRLAMESGFRTHMPLAGYAMRLGTSEPKLRRACLIATGQTPVQLLHARLLIEAERQLRYTSMTVAQVAYHLGFQDPAYFSRFFARHFGLSPRAFRGAL